MATTIQTFDDWVEAFHRWQKDIEFDTTLLGDFKFQTMFETDFSPTIEFGDFKGEPRWMKARDVPNTQIRDALLNLIVYQADTEFASVEQQRDLLLTAPSDYDKKSAVRIMSEEMRHGWQMCDLLVNHFGTTGAVEAEKQLQRRAWDNQRLLGSFNEPVNHWVDFFVYTQFVDRDGKFQLKMLSHCAFAPLGRSMGPMLKEEAFHLGTGNTGMKRIAAKGVIPKPLLQKYVNKWVPTAHDLFGKDRSGTAHWAYVWGLKCRYDEFDTQVPLEKENLNDHNRNLYHEECRNLVEKIDQLYPTNGIHLVLPSLKFNRAIGQWEGKPHDIHGNPLSDLEWEDYKAENLPNEEDEERLAEIFKGDWIAPK